MARGGYLRPEIAVEKLRQLTRSRNGAKRIIVEYLKAGDLASRGRRVQNMALLTSVDHDEMSDYSARVHEAIRAEYWAEAKSFDSKFWNWSAGYFVCPENWDNDNMGYVEVQFKERDVNAIFAQMISRPNATPASKERPRPEWNDWVAAVAFVAYEHRINEAMLQRTLLRRINDQLEIWGLDAKEDSTVAPAARAILRRWASGPPVNPLIPHPIIEKKL